MKTAHFSPSTRPTTTVGIGRLMAQYRDGIARIVVKDKPDREVGWFDAEIFTRLPFLLSPILECMAKDPTLSEETHNWATRMARSMRHAVQLRSTPQFSRAAVFNKAAELLDSCEPIEGPDISLCRQDLKMILGSVWGHAMEDFVFTRFEERANHVFPVLVRLYELVAGPSEELGQFVADHLSEEVESQVTEGGRAMEV